MTPSGLSWRALRIAASALATTAVLASTDAPASRAATQAAGPATLAPIPLYPKALGPFTRPISSSTREAQAYFDQAMQMMYAFDTNDAARSFREAQRRDPACAICFWGEAWAWGSYLNAPMPARQAPFAYAAIQRAKALAPQRASPVERALIDALSVRYVEPFDAATRRVQDEAYATAMQHVYEQYPDDVDVATLYADALFLLEPRRGSRDITAPAVQRILSILESATRRAPHVGACHLLIHLTEATTDPGRAEACADYIGTSIPGASHINHMPSHTWNGVGRWGDSVRANIHAWHSDQKAEVGEGFAIYPSHNLHMLAFAASMDGQGAVAVQAGVDYRQMTGDSMFEVLTLVRFGRFDQVLAVPQPSSTEATPIGSGVWAFGRGYAQLRKGNVAAAKAALEQVESASRSTAVFRFHSAGDLLGTLAALLEGEISRSDGRLDASITSFERAVRLESQMIYDEPEPLMFAARHWLGAALLDAKRFVDAERVYREDLAKHPHNGWSLFGLKAALDGQERRSPDVDRDLQSSWSRADTWLRRSAP